MTKLIFSIKAQVFWKERLVQVFSETLLRDQFEVFCCILKLWLHRLVGTMPHKKKETEQQLKKKKWLNHHWLDACFGSENMFGTRHANLSKINVVRQKLWNKCTNQESRDTTKLLIRKMGVLHSLFISPALKLTYYLASLLKLSLGMVSLISKTR